MVIDLMHLFCFGGVKDINVLSAVHRCLCVSSAGRVGSACQHALILAMV